MSCRFYCVVVALIGGCSGSTWTGPRANSAERAAPAAWQAMSLPHGRGGIGFDDIRYVQALDRVLVPAGQRGTVDVVSPGTGEVRAIPGFTVEPVYRGGHDVGPTSADGTKGLIVVVDRSARTLSVVDAKRETVIASAPLAAKPDLVRFVEARREVWVTEPEWERIEVFALSHDASPIATHSGFIAALGGPEGLTIDGRRGVAYTHLGSNTVAIDLATREVGTRWSPGCAAPAGIALDDTAALLLIGCGDGQVAVLDLSSARTLFRLPVGSSVDHVAFDSNLRHLYVPDTRSARLTILAVLPDGNLTALGTVATVRGTECVTADGRGHAYVCDPEGGRILVVTDPYPATGGLPIETPPMRVDR